MEITYNGIADAFLEKTDEFRELLKDLFHSSRSKEKSKLSEELRIFTRRYYGEHFGLKPMTFVHIH